MSQRFEGRNLEEALQHAAQTFGVERWQLTYHVLMEKRGFLGGVKRVVIEADKNEEAAAPAPPAPAPVVEARAPRGDRPRRGGGGGGGGGGRERRGNGGERGGRSRGGRRDRIHELQTGDFERYMGEIPEQGPESDDARSVREWLDDVIALARLDLVARTTENEEQILVKLYGADGKRLTEKHGELLDALQVLVNKAVIGRKSEKDIELDCEEFKGRRLEELGQQAREVADRVRRDGREELLPAMTPIERRIVHLALRDDAEVTTESRGEGFYKRVAIVRRTEAPGGVDVAPEQ
ncbi:MAG TPA: R3H domain-containing nucleic acid-binding protein [Thermoanaerobaculia bacterium]|nr:R3H domain-containing nucleic acid-binding protein [Thermoanaerobaculia bacterium]